MKVKLNPNVSIEDYDLGDVHSKILYNPLTEEGFYLEQDSFFILKPLLLGNAFEINQLYNDDYDLDEFKDFINLLINEGLLEIME